MARPEHEGTSRETRSKGYVVPSRKRPVLMWSLAATAVIVVGLVAGYFAGFQRTLSPGTVASHHARVDLKCAQCHEAGNQVTEVRCERCHDTSGSDRLTHPAHVLLGSGDIRKAEAAGTTKCATCHMEHRGLNASLIAVDDRECASCHNFSTLAGHPEFASVRAQATAGVGLKFDHDRHIVEAQKARNVSCQYCHEQTADRSGFAPIDFDRHCAACHLPNKVFEDTDPITPTAIVTPDLMPEPWRSRTKATFAPSGRKGRASGLVHRDAWILFNALRLRHGIDPDGVAGERLSLRGQIAYLEEFQSIRPVAQAPAAELEAAATQLRNEISELDQRLSGGSSPDADAIKEIFETTRAVAAQLGGLDAEAGAAAKEIGGASLTVTPPPAANDSAAQARFDRRKAELLKVLASIDARTTDQAVKQRAADLKGQVEKLAASPTGTAEIPPLLDRLGDLNDVIGAIRAIPDPGIQAQVAQIDQLKSYGEQRIAAGLSFEEFQARKAELLELLDTIERRGGPGIRLRTTALRARVVAARPGSVGDADLARDRAARQKQLDRILLELELVNSHDYEAPPSQDARFDQAGLQASLTRLRARLNEIDRAPRMPAPETAEDRDARRNELDALLSRCLKCHEYDPSGARMAPVRIAEPVMPRSIFNHAPHVQQASCETCHGSTAKSKLATDVNVFGVEGCRTCHNPSQAKSDCETCHVYHPSSPAKLLAVTP
jgi:hypothetical protein